MSRVDALGQDGVPPRAVEEGAPPRAPRVRNARALLGAAESLLSSGSLPPSPTNADFGEGGVWMARALAAIRRHADPRPPSDVHASAAPSDVRPTPRALDAPEAADLSLENTSRAPSSAAPREGDSALNALRSSTGSSTVSAAQYRRAGFAKYGACVGAGLFSAAPLLALPLPTAAAAPLSLIGFAIAFYAAEAQAVFLFPAMADESRAPLSRSRALVVSAGGTACVMARVLPIAFTMLFGGFGGRGFTRSWLRGCVAVLLFYEDVVAAEARG